MKKRKFVPGFYLCVNDFIGLYIVYPDGKVEHSWIDQGRRFLKSTWLAEEISTHPLFHYLGPL